MNKITLLLTLIITNFLVSAQVNTEPKPFIEITGTSEIKIIPDQIFISINLKENIDKSKRNINEMEQDLIKALESVGISSDKLSVTDANAYYGKSGVLSKEVVNTKLLELEVKDATQAKAAFTQMEKLNIKNAYITRVDHTQMEEYKKEAKIKAIKAAKDKANYLLAAVDEELGGALIVREQSINVFGNQMANTRGRSNSYYRTANVEAEETKLNFKKITVTASIYTKWRIGN